MKKRTGSRTSLTSGTRPTETRLSREEVCSILETSAKIGVLELKFGDLHATFGRPARQEDGRGPLAPYPFVQQPHAPPSVTALTEKEHQEQNSTALEADEVRLREEQLARALVEDPVAYERLLRDGELTDGIHDVDDDDGDDS
jgi:hypothetical protein